jgi:hypothetical protein
MPGGPKQQLDLSTFDDQLLDGLEFCARAYELFDQVRGGPDGVERLRLRRTKLEKRLIEELLPIARYVQARYREGRRIKVRWLSGSQPFDAVVWSSGLYVTHRMAPRRLVVEVTTSVHPNGYLVRKLLHERGGSFGVKGISRNLKTGDVVSVPHVHTNGEIATDLADQIIERIAGKAAKPYPPGLALIIQCETDSLIVDEWDAALERVRQAGKHRGFREVFIFDSVSLVSTTLYGRPRRRR